MSEDTTPGSVTPETGVTGSDDEETTGTSNASSSSRGKTGETQTIDTQYHDKSGDKEESKEDKKPAAAGKKKVYFMRHAERLDKIFPSWIKLAFQDKKRYRPYDLNQPLTLPKRDDSPDSFKDDTPITEMGYCTAQMVGRGMRLTKVHLAAIYTSPALRCMQTAHGILKTLGTHAKIRVEPGLFEWMGPYYSSPPKFLSRKEQGVAGFRVDADYKPIMTEKELTEKRKETGAEHYKRIAEVSKKILKRQTDGPILILGHGTTVDAGCRSLLEKKTTGLEKETLDQVDPHYPYCSIVGLEGEGDHWKLLHSTLPPITYMDAQNFVDSEFLNRKQ